MKKIILKLLLVTMTFGMVGCGDTTEPPKESDSSKNSQVIDVSEDMGGSENESSQKPNEQEPEIVVSMELLEQAKTSPVSDFEVFEVDGGIAIKSYVGKDLMVVIPDEIEGKPVVKISKWAFANVENVYGIKIGKNVVDCGDDEVFANCYNLEYVILGENVESIGEKCFNATNLKEIKTNEGLKEIGKMAFWATDLDKISIPQSVSQMGETIFNKKTVVYVKAGSYAEEYMKAYVEQWKGSKYVVE